MIDPSAPLWLSALLFGLGVVGVFTRRSLLTMLSSFQLIAGASVLALVTFDARVGGNSGQGFGVLILTLVAAQGIVALGLLVARQRIARRERGLQQKISPW